MTVTHVVKICTIVGGAYIVPLNVFKMVVSLALNALLRGALKAVGVVEVEVAILGDADRQPSDPCGIKLI